VRIVIESPILSMLIQHGGSLKQNEIAINLDLPQDIITSSLLDLEKQDMISREWLSDEFTYRISNGAMHPANHFSRYS